MSESTYEPREHSRRNRLFEAGHMKLLVLHLIHQSAKHGYEIIKDVGELVGGGYLPSAGTIYPTLNYLEDMQFIQSMQQEGDRKQYQITETGIVHLTQKQDSVQHILGRLETRREIQNNEQYLDIHRAMENLKTSLRLKLKSRVLTNHEVRQIAEQIDQAAVAISQIRLEANS